MVNIKGLLYDSDHLINDMKGVFSIVEHQRNLAVSPFTAQTEFFMSRMGVRQKQVLALMDGETKVITQSGAMLWMAGDVHATTGIKGAGDLLGKVFKSAVTNETVIKSKYVGQGYLMLEPTYKYLLLEEVSEWEDGMLLDDGLFMACEGTVKHKIEARSNVSSAVLGNMGFI